jgi:Holliday junction resolvase RusA-like endonuclease
MDYLEFEVDNALPPKSPSDGSIWINDNEVKRLIKFRKEAFKHFHRTGSFTKNIKLEIEIWTPEPQEHKMPGDLDNFIKGVCDSLFYEKSKKENEKFKLHGTFQLLENENIKPQRFEIIDDDKHIVEIWARMNYIKNEKQSHYRIRIEGS